MVDNKKYVPEQGDIVFLDYDKTSVGHEQRGRRPGIVVSDTSMNNFTGLCYVCPITNNEKCFPFQVEIPNGKKTSGIIMCEQMKAYDFINRKIKFIEKIDEFSLDEVLIILRGFML